MPEALTESFCERCGTRYEFQAPTQLSPLRKTRGLVSGLKNYIMSQDALSDAIGDAMRSEEETLAARQLEAFHDAFNFCIDCRQYACTNCWNDAAGRCRSCVPIPGKDDLADRLEAAYLADHQAMHAQPELAGDVLARRLGVEAWPESDLELAGGNGHAAAEWPQEPGMEAPAPALAEPEPELTVAEQQPAPAVPDAEPEPVLAEALAEPEPVLAEAVGEPEGEDAHVSRVLAWEDDTELALRTPIEEELPEPEIAWAAVVEPEPEPMVAEVAPEPEPEPMVAEVAPEPEPEPMVAEVAPEPEPEPMVAEVAPEPEPEPMVAEVAPEPEPIRPIRPISETILRVQPRLVEPEPAAADGEALAARRAQLDLLGLEDPGQGTVAPERPRVLPYRSSGAAVHPSELVQRTLGGSTALWDASAREVAAARSMVAVQSCGSCGLSLSASARFCRRCGTRQAQSA